MNDARYWIEHCSIRDRCRVMDKRHFSYLQTWISPLFLSLVFFVVVKKVPLFNHVKSEVSLKHEKVTQEDENEGRRERERKNKERIWKLSLKGQCRVINTWRGRGRKIFIKIHNKLYQTKMCLKSFLTGRFKCNFK